MSRAEKRTLIRELTRACVVARARLAEADAALRRGGTGEGGGGADASTLLEALRSLLGDNDDVVFRTFRLRRGPKATLVYIDGLAKKEDVEERIIQPLVRAAPVPARDGVSLRRLAEEAVTAAEVKLVPSLDEVVREVLGGATALVVDGQPGAVVIASPGWKGREVEKPSVEFSLRGPREGFSETLIWNIALVRRRLRDPGLRVRKMRIGARSQTEVALLYLEGVANPDVVAEAERRLKAIRIDGILDAGYVEQLIEDCWWSPFPTVNGSERPDVVVAGLLEGRVAILVDTSSFALIVPSTFDGLFHSPEDSYDRWLPVNLLRFLRFLASGVALFTPALYVATASFNPGLMPLKLALKVAASREGVAFPVLFEALFAQFALELLKEAGFRMPSPVSQIFGVVGGLVLGDLGVRAGVFSEIMMIVIALTAIASFSIPTIPLGTVVRLLGLPLMISTAVLGMFGLVMGLLAILAHLATLRSFGVPYLVPYAYFSAQDLKDTVIKQPLPAFRRRPTFLRPRDAVMQDPDRQTGRETSR